MEGIEVSFPLTVCRDLLVDSQNLGWRVYQASISPGKPDGKKTLGSLRARVVSTEAGQVVDLILTFPRHTIKCPAVKGRLRCRAENVRLLCENEPDLSVAVPNAAKSRPIHQQTDTDSECVSDDKSNGRARPLLLDHAGDHTASPKSEASSRPSRRREKPSKYKDYVGASGSSTRSTSPKTNIQNASPGDSPNEIRVQTRTPTSTPTRNESPSKSCKKPSNMLCNDKDASVALPPSHAISGNKRFVRKYDKLIKNLEQASAKSGLEMLSVISGYKSAADLKEAEASLKTSQDTDHKLSVKDKTNTMQVFTRNVNSETDTRSEVVASAAEGADGDGSTSTDGHIEKAGTENVSISGKNTSISPADQSIISSGDHSSKSKPPQSPLFKLSPFRTSFPRKFPSSLTRTDVLDVSLCKVTERKRRSTSTEILRKYKKIQPAEKPADKNDAENTDNGGNDVCKSFQMGKEFAAPDQSKKKPAQRQSSQVAPTKDVDADRNESTAVPGAVCISPAPVFLPVDPTNIQQNRKEVNNLLLGPFQIVNQNQLGSSANVKSLSVGSFLAPSGVSKGHNVQNMIVKDAHGNVVRVQGQQESRSAEDKPKPIVPALTDHDYTDAVLGRKTAHSSKALKTLVKPISLAQHISARVERVEEGEGSSLVTISGLNSKAAGGSLPLHFLPSPKTTPEGFPIANSLEEAMTDMCRRREKQQERYQQACSAESSPAIQVGINDVPVTSEITITPTGQQYAITNRHVRQGSVPRGRPRKYPLVPRSPLACSETVLKRYPATEGCPEVVIVERKLSEERENTNAITLQMTQVASATDSRHAIYDDTQDEQTRVMSSEMLHQGVIGASFIPGEEIVVFDGDEPDDDVAIDNAEDVSNSQYSYPTKTCGYCMRLFLSSGMLYKHVKSVHGCLTTFPGHQEYLKTLKLDSRTSCPYCQQTLSSDYKLRSHLANFHANQLNRQGKMAYSLQPQCEVCQVNFHTLSELKAHATLLHNSDVRHCAHCPLVFVQESARGVHMSEVHGDHSSISFPCKLCDSCFDSKLELSLHKQETHGRRPRRQWTERDLGSALQPEERVKCLCCHNTFSTNAQLQLHRRLIHTGPVPVHCVFCGLGYQSLKPMHNHLHTHLHGDEGESPQCPFCEASAPQDDVASLVNHVLEKHGDQFPFSCNICQQSFTADKMLRIHLLQAHKVTMVTRSLLRSPGGPGVSAADCPVVSEQVEPVDETTGESVVEETPTEDAVVGLECGEMESELFLSLPPEAQERIRLITQQGDKATLTINDGKGGVQQVTFRPVRSGASLLRRSSVSSTNSHTECSEMVVNDGAAFDGGISAIEEAPSTVENVIYGVSLAADTDVAMETEVLTGSEEIVAATCSINRGTESVSDTEGLSLAVSGISTAAEETQLRTESPDTAVPPYHIVLVQQDSCAEDVQVCTEEDTIIADSSEFTTVTIETAGSDDITMTTDDFMALVKHSHSTSGRHIQ